MVNVVYHTWMVRVIRPIIKKNPMLISNPVHVPPLISGFWGPRFDGELSFRGGP